LKNNQVTILNFMNLNLIEHKMKINQEAELEFCEIYLFDLE